MLTKDLLRHRRRGDKVYPGFISPRDPNLLAAAEILLGAFGEAPGQEMAALEEELEGIATGPKEIIAGLTKLLFDQCAFVEDDGTAEDFRWKIFQTAEKLRAEQEFSSREEFESVLGLALGHDSTDLKSRLYVDLPEHRKILSFECISPEALLHRYNCALVQGLLLRSAKVEIKAKKLTLAAKRRFFRALKFSRLLSLVDTEGSDSALMVQLSGPLSLFQQAQTYGMRIANFFPYVLHLDNWELEAEVKLGERHLILSLNQDCGIQSHYQKRDPYVPPELSACLNQFNDTHQGAQLALAEAFVNIGRESYCFPDLMVTYKDSGRQVNFELFHRWHAGQLKGRLSALEKNPVMDLRLGVCKSLSKDGEVGPYLERSEWFQKYGFFFRDFPTANNLWQALKGV